MISSTAESFAMHTLEHRSDEALVELAARGEATSFTILAGRHRVKALRIACGILHNRADAEDAVQNAFVRAYRHLMGFRGTCGFASWLYRIVVNESIRLLRSARVRAEDAELDEDRASTDGADPERALLVRQCLASLPERLRIVLALRGVDELDYAEIASILDLPIGTVRSRLHEARKLFAERWKEAMKDEV